MKSIRVQDAVGMVLCHDVTEIVPGKFKGPSFCKGHVIQNSDIEKLLDIGKRFIYVFELTKDQLHENEAAKRIAKAAAGPGLFLAEPVEGKVTLSAAVKGIFQLDLVNKSHQIHVRLIHRDRLVVITRTSDFQQTALPADRQFVGPIDHFFALDPSIRPSATAKKSFSIVSCPILAWSSLTSGSFGFFCPFSKTSEAFSRSCFFHSVT